MATARRLRGEWGVQQYMMLRHHDDPGAGIEVLARESGPSELDLREFLAAFDLDRGVVSWALAQENGTSSASGNHAPTTPALASRLSERATRSLTSTSSLARRTGPLVRPSPRL
jgi:hypothetical protein